MVIAALFVLVFGLDLAIKVPFQRASAIIDIGFLIGAIMLGFASYNAYREIR